MRATSAYLVEVVREGFKRFPHALFRFLFDVFNHCVCLFFEPPQNRSSLNQSAFVSTAHNTQQGATLRHIKDPDGHVMISHQTNCRQVHYAQFFVQYFVVSQDIVLYGIGIFYRVGALDTVHLRCLQHNLRFDFDAAEAGRGIGCEKGVTGARRKNNDVAIGKRADGLSTIVMLDNTAHRNR